MQRLPLSEFIRSATPDDLTIIRADDHWEAHCRAGVLENELGSTGFADLVHLLAVLASVGIRRCPVEWDGLPATVPVATGPVPH